MTTREEIKQKVISEEISLYKISKATQLTWITVKNYVLTEMTFNPTTELLIKNFLGL